MKISSIFICILVTSAIVSHIFYSIPDIGCGDDLDLCEDELSLLETILLFPVSMFPSEIPDHEEMFRHDEAAHERLIHFITNTGRKLSIMLTNIKEHLYKTTAPYLQWTSEVIYAEYLLEVFSQRDVTLVYMKEALEDVVFNAVYILSTLYSTIEAFCTNAMFSLSSILSIFQSALIDMTVRMAAFADSFEAGTHLFTSLVKGHLVDTLGACTSVLHYMWTGSGLGRLYQVTLDATKLQMSSSVVTGVLAVLMVPLFFKAGIFRRGASPTPSKPASTKRTRPTKRLLELPSESSDRSSLNMTQAKEQKYTQTLPVNSTLPSLFYNSHYPMCESYDSLACNCGGGERDSSFSRKKHYGMCEYFDGEFCNCGGKDGKIISVGTKPMSDSLHVNISGTSPEQSKLVLHLVNQENVDYPNVTKRDGSAQTNSFTSPSVPKDNAFCEKESADNTPTTGRLSNGKASEDRFEDSELSVNNVNELHVSIDSDIGRPCFNSSFKDDSPLSRRSRLAGRASRNSDIMQQSLHSDSQPMGEGDRCGSPSIVTRRSPRKEVGVSFRSDGMVSETTSMFESDLSTSLLDVTDITKNLSFNQGDGVVEFAVMFAIQSAYRLTKWFLQRHNLTLNATSTNLDATDVDLYVISPRKRQEGTASRNVSFNASIQSNPTSLEMQLTDSERWTDSEDDVGHMSLSNESVGGSDYLELFFDDNYSSDFGDLPFDFELKDIDIAEDKLQQAQEVPDIARSAVASHNECCCKSPIEQVEHIRNNSEFMNRSHNTIHASIGDDKDIYLTKDCSNHGGNLISTELKEQKEVVSTGNHSEREETQDPSWCPGNININATINVTSDL